MSIKQASLDWVPGFATDSGQKSLRYGHTGRGAAHSLLELVTTGDWSVSLETLHFLDLKTGWQDCTLVLKTPWSCLWMWMGKSTSSFSLISNWNVAFPLIVNVGKKNPKIYLVYSWLLTSKNWFLSHHIANATSLLQRHPLWNPVAKPCYWVNRKAHILQFCFFFLIFW